MTNSIEEKLDRECMFGGSVLQSSASSAGPPAEGASHEECPKSNGADCLTQ